MSVSPLIQARVMQVLREKQAICEAKYGKKLPLPRVEYNLTGRSMAGMAWPKQNRIQLNVDMLNNAACVDEMVNQVGPHELAHIYDEQVFPGSGERKDGFTVTRSGRLRRAKRDIHGWAWKNVMSTMGLSADRCHQMGDEIAPRKVTARYDWLCKGCGTTIQLGPKHNAAKLRGDQVWHKTCKGYDLVKPAGSSFAPVNKPVAPPAPKMDLQKAPEAGTKLQKCWNLYKSYSHLGRGALIAMFVNEADCTPAGAGTYYATCKKKYEAGVI